MHWQREFPWEHKSAHHTHLIQCRWACILQISPSTDGERHSYILIQTKHTAWCLKRMYVLTKIMISGKRFIHSNQQEELTRPAMSSRQLIHQCCPHLCCLLICQVCLRTITSRFAHINVKMPKPFIHRGFFFFFFTFMKLWTLRTNNGVGSPVDFPFLEHSCGRMMHSLWDADCYSCRYMVPLRKGGAYRWHHAAPWSAVRMSQVNVGRLKVTAFLMSRNKIILR